MRPTTHNHSFLRVCGPCLPRTALALVRGAVVCGLLVACATSSAGPVIWEPVQFTNSPSLSGWTNAVTIGTEDSTLDNPGSGGADNDGYLRITFGGTGIPIGLEEDTIYTQEGDRVGDFRTTNVGFLSFYFYSSNASPVSLGVHWHSTNMAAGDRWEYAITPTPTSTGTWELLTVPFATTTGWTGPGGRDFFTDLAYVDWIGVNSLNVQSAIDHVYGIDSWMYHPVPEPETYALIAAALLAVTMVARRSSLDTGVT